MRGNDAYSRSVAAPTARRRSSRSSSARSPLQREIAFELLPQIVEQQRILTQLLRKHPLRQAGREHDLEHSAPGLMRAADEDASVSIRRRLHLERQQSSGEDIADFEQRDRSDCGHRPQIGEHPQHVFRLAEDARREPLEALQPIAPGRFVGPLRDRLDQRERKGAQVLEILQLAFEVRNARRVWLVFRELANLQAILLRQTIQAPRPALAAADDSRLDEQAFPFPGRPERARRTSGLVIRDLRD